MPGDDDSSVEWVRRDSREWALFAHQPDQLTARMTCTYLEAGGVEARVGTHGGEYCVEVPEQQLELAYTVYSPPESGVQPAMQEDSRKTGVHTGKHLRDVILRAAAKRERQKKGHPAIRWLLRVIVIAALIGLLLLIFAD